MSDVIGEQVERTLRVFLRLLDLSRDLERNDDDSMFRAEGGNVHYVFDADLFEIFVRPWDSRGNGASLHTREWATAGPEEVISKSWKAIASQTALSATEYLVSGTLPAQRDAHILMTWEHRWELARRTAEMARSYTEQLEVSRAERSLERFQQVKVISSYLANSEREWQPIREHDPLLYDDLRALDGENLPRKNLTQFGRTRSTLRALVDDRVLEPAEQVERIVGPTLRRRITTLHQKFPLRRDDSAFVAADARQWFARLLEEARIQGVQIATGTRSEGSDDDGEAYRGRSTAALWDDARSLATARWIASHNLSSKVRLAFVTADALMFDAYRRWYANLRPTEVAYSEPFLLRRLMQFAPMFNLVDFGKFSGVRARQVFKDLRHLLEINLLTLNLSRLRSRPTSEPILTRMRELSALRATDSRAIVSDELYAGLTRVLRHQIQRGALAQLESLLNDLRLLERIALGQLDDHVRARLSDRETKYLGLTSRAGSAQVVRYVGNLIHKMLSASFRLWVPLAREFIDSWRPRPGDMLVRAPVAIRLQITGRGHAIDIGGALNKRLRHEDDAAGPLLSTEAWELLEGDEALVFGIASVLALASADWSNAEHFSDMALKSYSPNRSNDDRLAEYRYLASISKRFRIGVNGVPLSADALNRLWRTYRTAEEHINSCVSYHERSGSSKHQPLRSLRSYSERAALRLFFAVALSPPVREAIVVANAGKRNSFKAMSVADYVSIVGDDPSVLAKNALTDAGRDLVRCVEIGESLAASVTDDRRQTLGIIQRQYLANICSGVVLGNILRVPQNEQTFPPVTQSLVSRVRSFLKEHSKTAHSLMRAEMLAFLSIAGDPLAADEIVRITAAPALTLDRALLRVIQKAAGSRFA